MALSPSAADGYDVFLSYQHEDEDWTKGLAYQLRKAGLRVFHAPSDIKPGENFVFRIEGALASARFFVLVLSPEALTAEWPTAERAAAVISDPAGRFGRVIPLLHRSCQLPPLLAFRNYIDFRDQRKFKAGLRKLIAVVKGEPLEHQTITATSMAVSSTKASLSAINAAAPDDVTEELFSNLFPVRSLPDNLWSAPTRFVRKDEVYRYFGACRTVPAFILKEKRIFTFVDLGKENNAFVGAVEPFDTQKHDTSIWMDNEDHIRWLVELLNDLIRSYSTSLGLSYDKFGKRNFFAKGVLSSERIAWTPHVRRGLKDLILEYSNRERPGEVGFYAHRAVGLRFELLGNNAFLRLDPGWVFTLDGKIPIEGRRRSVLSTKFLSSQRNLRDFSEMRFWAWLLSADGKTIKLDLGNGHLEVSTKPLSVSVRGGIFGDSVPLPETIEVPPNLFRREPEEEKLLEAQEGEDDEEP